MPTSSTSTSITSATTATLAPSLERGSEGPLSSSASGSGKGYQHHLKAGSAPHDSLPVSAPHSSPAYGAAPLTGHSTSRSYPQEGTEADDDSRRYPHHSHPPSSSSGLGYFGRGGPLPEHGDSNIEESSSSAGEAGPIVSRQRHTSLPQVLSHQSSNYPHPHHPHLQHPPPEELPAAAGYSSNPQDRRPLSPPQYHYPHPSHHTPGASMTSTSSTSSTSSSSASYFGLQNASRAQQQRQYEQPGINSSGSSSNSAAQTPYSMYYHPEHYRARSPSSPSSYYEDHPHHPHHPHGSYSHPYHHPDRLPPSPHRSSDEWYDGRSSYHHQGHPYYDAADRYQPPYPPPRLYTPPHHLQHPHHHHQDRRHLTSLPIRHHSRFPRRMSQPSTAGGGSDPESRYIPFLNVDLHEQDIRDPYVKRLANSDHQLPSSPSPVQQPRNVGSSKTSAIVNLASSSSVTTTCASGSGSGSGSTSGSQSTGTTSGNNGTSLPVRGGPSTAFGGLVTNASGAPTAAIPGLVFSSRGDNTGSRTQFHAPLEPEVVAKLDDIFFKFLQRICSDLKACDAKGDHIHQPLMAKKMERLEASTEFRPFKFRIQAFTNAFHDSLIQHGLTEDVLPLRKVKLYLWKHRYISRFNEDGKNDFCGRRRVGDYPETHESCAVGVPRVFKSDCWTSHQVCSCRSSLCLFASHLGCSNVL
ncbi:MAG: hypothetical protein JOS17DRAFT_328464 [Linnemannia elongata]|nr:MAG: hypothetical protein JOS17DRAFT_328464 [Linnemannia elongata]